MLDAASKEQFARHGFVRLPKFLSAQETADLVRWTDEITAWPETPGKWMRYYEKRPGGDGKMLARIENFVPYHAGLATVLTKGRILEVLAECCGEPVVLFKDKINFKYPGGAAFTPHQDAPAYVNFGVRHHLTLMVPVDPFTLDNGCLVMALDACERKILPQNPDGTVRADVLERLVSTPLLAEPGDVIVFDAWVPHWSGRNDSQTSRRTYYMTFNPASAGDHRADYYARKRELFPPEYERRPGVDYAKLGAQFNLANPFE
ncbi:MAG TPA: phytanoyl-CoA dioxygenase family protein [Candidatus Eisenbacteria bacterium]|nr:phytanoyl-CoA dioxygenase family protein [Candidatus Eisenbacteria bacterium]